MTIITDRLAALDTIHLDKGAHDNFDEGHCAMEVVAWLAGQGHTDAPSCIALTLEALRKVDRYGATQSDEQYTGYRQIGAAPAAIEDLNPWATLRSLAGVHAHDHVEPERIIRLARRNAHPDHGGTSETWARFDTACKAVRP